MWVTSWLMKMILLKEEMLSPNYQKANFLCMARVGHLHLQIGQDYL